MLHINYYISYPHVHGQTQTNLNLLKCQTLDIIQIVCKILESRIFCIICKFCILTIVLLNCLILYSKLGLGSSLRGEPGLTTFRSQVCPWKSFLDSGKATHIGGVPGSAAYDKKKPSNCSKSVKKLTLLLAVSQKISAKLFRSWLLGRPRLLCC